MAYSISAEAASAPSDAWAVTPAPWSVRVAYCVTETAQYVTSTTLGRQRLATSKGNCAVGGIFILE